MNFKKQAVLFGLRVIASQISQSIKDQDIRIVEYSDIHFVAEVVETKSNRVLAKSSGNLFVNRDIQLVMGFLQVTKNFAILKQKSVA